HDQQCDLLVSLLQTGERAFVACLDQTLHQVSGPGEKYAITPASGFDAEHDRKHRFAGADRSGDDYRLGLRDKLAARPLENLGLRNAFKRRPINLVQGFYVGKARLPQQSSCGALTPACNLSFEQLA